MTVDTPVRLSDAAVIPLPTLDPVEPLEDLAWLDDAIGDARVVAIGESAHYNAESYLLRHRLLRYLVQRQGFSAYAFESGFVEGWLVDDWVRGGHDQLDAVMANGITSLMGLWTSMRAHLEWMRQHNSTAARPVGFYGIDLSGSNVSLLPGLDAVIAFLAQADPGFQVDASLRKTAATFSASSAFGYPATVAAYNNLTPERRDALTAGLSDLSARMTARQYDYIRQTSNDHYQRALRALRLTATIDASVRAIVRGDQQTTFSNRDAAIADTVEWILQRQDRIVLAAHNGHIQRTPASVMPDMPPATPMGVHLADRLGAAYLVMGMTAGTGQTPNTGPDFYTGTLFASQEAPRPGSLDAVMTATDDRPFVTDLRRLSPTDAATVQAVTHQRFGTMYTELNPLDAYDMIVHLPHVTAAQPDRSAIACSPPDVQEAFSHYNAR